MQDEIAMQDEVTINKETAEVAPNRTTYVVTAEAGLFKNGRQYDKGEQIELDPATAERFKTLGEVADV